MEKREIRAGENGSFKLLFLSQQSPMAGKLEHSVSYVVNFDSHVDNTVTRVVNSSPKHHAAPKSAQCFTKTSRARSSRPNGSYFVSKRGLEGVAAGSGSDPMFFRPLLLPLSLNPSDLQVSNTE